MLKKVNCHPRFDRQKLLYLRSKFFFSLANQFCNHKAQQALSLGEGRHRWTKWLSKQLGQTLVRPYHEPFLHLVGQTWHLQDSSDPCFPSNKRKRDSRSKVSNSSAEISSWINLRWAAPVSISCSQVLEILRRGESRYRVTPLLKSLIVLSSSWRTLLILWM